MEISFPSLASLYGISRRFTLLASSYRILVQNQYAPTAPKVSRLLSEKIVSKAEYVVAIKRRSPSCRFTCTPKLGLHDACLEPQVFRVNKTRNLDTPTQNTMSYDFKNNTPIWLSALIAIPSVLAIIPAINLILILCKNFSFSLHPPVFSLTELGQLGDFFGGHTSAFAGSISLSVVFFFAFHQSKQQSEFFRAQRQAEDQHATDSFELQRQQFTKQQENMAELAAKAHQQEESFFVHQKQAEDTRSKRQFFLEGINLISQWDIKEPGCDQCMRLLDYYSRMALNSDDNELFLLLNTVITDKIRENLKGKHGVHHQRNYSYAVKAQEKISQIREAEMKPQKGY